MRAPSVGAPPHANERFLKRKTPPGGGVRIERRDWPVT